MALSFPTPCSNSSQEIRTEAAKSPPVEWFERAHHYPEVSLDVGFILHDSFYYGPENDFSQQQWQSLRAPLYRPAIELYRDFYGLSSRLGDQPAELAKYYESIQQLARQHGRTLQPADSLFWARPLIFVPGRFCFTFPWYDTVEESRSCLNGLLTGHFDDQDQGWRFEAQIRDQRLYMRQSDPDREQDLEIVCVPAEVLQSQIPDCLARLEAQIRFLSQRLGRNYWTR